MIAQRVLRTARPNLLLPRIARRNGSHGPGEGVGQYHYPEGPGTNIPFNPKTRFFFLRYWGTVGIFFGMPFGIAYWQMHKNK